MSRDITGRREWDSNPRWVAPHTLSKRADSAALASLRDAVPGRPPRRPGAVAPRTRQAIVWRARDRRWRPGPVQLQPVNRVRAGRQQLSADPAVCRRSPGRHLRGRGVRQEGCESGRIGTLGKRVWGDSPWVRIPLPPPRGPGWSITVRDHCVDQDLSSTSVRRVRNGSRCVALSVALRIRR